MAVVAVPSDRASRMLESLHGGPVNGRGDLPRRYLAVPNLRRAAIVVPDSRPGMAGRVLVNQNLLRRPTRRVVRRAVSIATGVPGLRRLVGESVVRTFGDHGLALLDHLGDVLGQPVSHAAIVGLRGERHTPTIELFDDNARLVAFVKAASGVAGSRRIRQEAAGLMRCQEMELRDVLTPKPLYYGDWRDLAILVTAPLPGRIRRFGPRRSVPPLRATVTVASLTGMHRIPLASSGYLADLRTRSGSNRVLRRLVDELGDGAGDQTMVFGAWHGDWVPWNLGWAEHRTLVAWDWEYWGPEAPLGFDLLLYFFAWHYIVGKEPILVAFRRAVELSLPARRQLGQLEGAQGAVEALFLTEMLVRQVEKGRPVPGGADELVDQVRRQLRRGLLASAVTQ